MKRRRMAIGNTDFWRQRFSNFCRQELYLIGLADFRVLVNNINIFPNIKEEINV